MRYAFAFLLLAVLAANLALSASGAWARLLLAALTFCFLALAAAFGLGRPGLLLKRPSGALSLWSYVIYWPYHAMNLGLLGALRHVSHERPYDEIVPGLFLGGRLLPRDRHAHFAHGPFAVLDLTAEFGECAFLGASPHYRCMPLFDTGAPSLEQLRSGAEWIAEQMASRPVYVHCALGHGRSATFVAAYLLVSGKARSAEEAIAMVRERRPRVGLSRRQRQVLEELEKGKRGQTGEAA